MSRSRVIMSCMTAVQLISKSNHVKFARFVLLGVSEEAKKMTLIFSVQCIIKQLLDLVFVIFRIR